ncbi:hypothetical protein PQR34_29970 [Paraburkholderia sediminicola]|uniref:hypothetical protein n=1 Tax=Paraburkholderia sediminicola TaxID=458836 RepID=UPI0038B97127
MTEKIKSDSQSWSDRILYLLANWGLFAAGAANLYVGTRSAIETHVASAATSLTAGLVLLFAATINRFESLKGLGIEAKTRQLDQKISEADEALERLRELTELTGTAIVDLGSKMGRWDSALAPREAYELAQKVKSIMEALGSDRSALRLALRTWVRMTCLDLSIAISAPLRIAAAHELNELRKTAVQSNQTRIDELQTFLDRLNQLGSYEIEDYPDRFKRLVDNAPVVAGDTPDVVKKEAAQYAAEMGKLREDLCFADPDVCLDRIEKGRKPN